MSEKLSAIERIKNVSVGLAALGFAIVVLTLTGMTFDYLYAVVAAGHTASTFPLYVYPMIGVTVAGYLVIFSMLGRGLLRVLENVGEKLRGEHL